MTPPTPVAYNPQVHGPLDGSYGYDDTLLTRRADPDIEGGRPHRINNLYGLDVDAVVQQDGVVSTSELSTLPWLLRGDQLLHLENGALVIRRSRFLGTCGDDQAQSSHVFRLTEAEINAVAFFSDSGAGSEWCGYETGLEVGELVPVVTPWNMEENSNLAQLKLAVELIHDLKGSEEKFTEWSEGRSEEEIATAQRLLASVSEDRIETILGQVQEQWETNKSILESILENPWKMGLIMGLTFAVGMLIVETVKYIATRPFRGGGGGDDPPASGGSWRRSVEGRLDALEGAGEAAPAEVGDAAQLTALVDGMEVVLPEELAHFANASYSYNDFVAATGMELSYGYSEMAVAAPAPAEVAPAMDLLGNAQAFTQFYGEQGISPQAVSTMTTVPGVSIALTPGVVPYAAPMVAPEAPMPTINLKMPSFAPAPRLAPALRPVF